MIINIIETTNMTNYAYRELSESITVISNLVNLWNLMLNIFISETDDKVAIRK